MRPVPGRWIIAAASRLVPVERRAAWRREWEAETTWAWDRARASGRDGPLHRFRLRLRVAGCLMDAFAERTETMTMTGMTNDLKYAIRGLARRPGFTAVAILTLALGIGASTAVFSIVDGVLLEPLPFPEPDRLVALEHLGRDGEDELPVSSGLYRLYDEQSATLEGVAMFTGTAANVLFEGEPERVLGQAVTPDFFDVMGVATQAGRAFLPQEGLPDGEQVVLLSEGLWRDRFGADPGVVGTSLVMNGVSRRIVGVMPSDFGYPDRQARFWVPLVVDPNQAALANFFAGGVGRITDGRSLEAVREELSTMMGRLDELYPEDGAAEFLMNVNLQAVVTPLKETLVGDIRPTLLVLMGTVFFVLLIACANVANLLLVRAEGRQQELALRVALGAGRADIIRAFMGESALLAGIGGLLGLAVAAGALRVTTSLIPADLPRVAEVSMDGGVLAFTALVVGACALFFGAFPILRYGADDLAERLKEGGGPRGATGGPESHRIRNGLLVSQVALALVLLVGSGLMLRSFLALRAVDPGFDPAGTLTARIIVPSGEIEDPRETAEFFRALRERLAAQPGVEAVGYTSSVPLSGQGMSFGGIEVEDHPRDPGELPVFAAQPRIGPGYLEAMGITLVEGRTLVPGDGGDGTRSIIVNRAFSERWWPDASALGRRIRFGGADEAWYQIVGVVEDVRETSLEEPAGETVYFPTLVSFDAENWSVARAQDVVVRTAGDPLAFLPVLRREIRALNPRIPVASPRTVASVFRDATSRTSFTMTMLGAASGVALLLGLVGIYGVISYTVSQRTREIGVRMALGASAPDVRGMVVRQGVALAVAGVVVGLLAAIGLSRLMASLLFEVDAVDPATYAGVAIALVAVSALASWIPALRAAGIDPSRALRSE